MRHNKVQPTARKWTRWPVRTVLNPGISRTSSAVRPPCTASPAPAASCACWASTRLSSAWDSYCCLASAHSTPAARVSTMNRQNQSRLLNRNSSTTGDPVGKLRTQNRMPRGIRAAVACAFRRVRSTCRQRTPGVACQLADLSRGCRRPRVLHLQATTSTARRPGLHVP
jgi:hypothetical protein